MGLRRSKYDLWDKGENYHALDSEWDDLPSRKELYNSVIDRNPVVSRQYGNNPEVD